MYHTIYQDSESYDKEIFICEGIITGVNSTQIDTWEFWMKSKTGEMTHWTLCGEEQKYQIGKKVRVTYGEHKYQCLAPILKIEIDAE